MSHHAAVPTASLCRRRAGKAKKAVAVAEEELLQPVTHLDFEIALTHVRPGTSQAETNQQVRGVVGRRALGRALGFRQVPRLMHRVKGLGRCLG